MSALFLLPENLHRCFQSIILWADHKERLFAPRGSLEKHGLVLPRSAFLDRGLSAFAVILGFKNHRGGGRGAIYSHFTGDSS